MGATSLSLHGYSTIACCPPKPVQHITIQHRMDAPQRITLGHLQLFPAGGMAEDARFLARIRVTWNYKKKG